MRIRFLLLAILAGALLPSCEEPDPGRSRMKLDSTPPSEVYLNGESAGQTPLDLRLEPGQYEVVFKLPGFKDHVNSIPLPASSEVELSAPLVAVELVASSEDLVLALKEAATDLNAFFAELGQQPPGALAEVTRVVEAGKVPTRQAEREQLRNQLSGLADTIESLDMEEALVARVRLVIDQLE